MRWLGRMITFSLMAGSAVLVAFALVHVAHEYIGITRLAIRHSALIATALVAMLLLAV